VEPPEPVSEIQRHDQQARAQDKRVLGLAEIEAADTADKQVADGKVEEAPVVGQSDFHRVSHLRGFRGIIASCLVEQAKTEIL
jgi:hypothetical protein